MVSEQSKRLFEAMCAERRWGGEDWVRDLLEHPLVGRLCRRIAWRVESSDVSSFTVRPRGGGEEIDAAGAVRTLPPGAQISIAHDANTPAAEGMAWLAHFADYAVEQLFPQFNRGLPDPSDMQLDGGSIDDFEGYLIPANRLSELARKLGYRRGEAIDGPEFYDYRKSYPTLRLEARIEFSGAIIAGSVHGVVALERLTFWSIPEPGAIPTAPQRTAISDLPPILLLESFRDLREIAESGSGYDSDWRQRAWRPA